MPPELLDPVQYGLEQSNPSKESDVYSLAMTAFEVLSSNFLARFTHGHPFRIPRYSRTSCPMVQGESRA